jgi:protein SCO1/2
MKRAIRAAIWASSGVAALSIMFGATFVAGAFLSPRADQILRVNPDLTVPAFSLIDQEGRAVSDQSLRGKVWVAAFFLSRCSDSCPMLTARMKSLQATLDSRAMLVLFTMDPAHDTQEVLDDYAKKIGVDADRWRLLSGDRAQIVNLAAALRPDGRSTAAENLSHSDRLVLIDANGIVKASFDAKNPQDLERLRLESLALNRR